MFTLDVDAAGLAGAFDLVFTSITPAVTAKGVLHKLMKMSRAMCCNVSFVHVGDTLLERVSRDVFGGKNLDSGALRYRISLRPFYGL